MPSVVTSSEYAIYWIGMAGILIFGAIVVAIRMMK